MMTKKDFIALADAIRDHNAGRPCTVGPPFDAHQLDVLAAFCASQNTKFDWDHWFAYIHKECGPNSGAIRKPKGKSA